MPPRLTLVLGGVRSGKSAFAEGLVSELSRPTLYLATGQATDAEMVERIRRHRERRPTHWLTIEEPLEPLSALAKALSAPNPPKTVLLDSLDVWVANLLLAHENQDPASVETRALAELELLMNLSRQAETQSILVSSEGRVKPPCRPTAWAGSFKTCLGQSTSRPPPKPMWCIWWWREYRCK